MPDCSVIDVGHDMSLVSSNDFFTPIVGDSYQQGQIAFCNTVSDVYVMGIDKISTILMILSVSTQMSKNDRFHTTSEMIRGFVDKAKEAKTEVTGGHTVMNPWVMIGGAAMSVVPTDDLVMNNAKPGDQLVLTKPLGTQHTTNLKEWMVKEDEIWKKSRGLIAT